MASLAVKGPVNGSDLILDKKAFKLQISYACQKIYLLCWHNALCFLVLIGYAKNYAGIIDSSLINNVPMHIMPCQ